MAMVSRILGALGRALVAFGVLVLLFVVYLLWGTGISESGHQSALTRQFAHILAAKPPSPPPSSTTTIPTTALGKLVAGDAPAAGQPVAIIVIPKISLDKVVVQGTGVPDLRLGPGHYAGTPLPGQPGNAAIAGHRTTYGAPFYNLSDLKVGDNIDVTTAQGNFVYRVVRSFIVSPTDNSVLKASTSAMLTLTTCNPRYSASQRLVVQADLTGSPALAPARAPARSASGVGAGSNLAGSQGAWGAAALWGAALLAAAAAIWLASRRRERVVRWAIYMGTVIPVLVVLYFFFEAVNPLLPASY